MPKIPTSQNLVKIRPAFHPFYAELGDAVFAERLMDRETRLSCEIESRGKWGISICNSYFNKLDGHSPFLVLSSSVRFGKTH